MKKYLLTLLVASVSSSLFAFDAMTPDDIFSAIDGEYNHVDNTVTSDSHTFQRTNFSMSEENNPNLLNEVLSGIDGEYEYSSDDTRINYSLSQKETDDLSQLENVLSAIGGSND